MYIMLGVSIQVRQAQIADFEYLSILYQDVVADLHPSIQGLWSEEYPQMMLANDIAAGHQYLAEEDDQLIGSFVLSPSPLPDKRVAWDDPHAPALVIERFTIHPKYQGRGYGHKLLAAAREIANAQNISTLRLFIAADNTPAAKCYTRFGFNEIPGGYREHYDKIGYIAERAFELDLAA